MYHLGVGPPELKPFFFFLFFGTFPFTSSLFSFLSSISLWTFHESCRIWTLHQAWSLLLMIFDFVIFYSDLSWKGLGRSQKLSTMIIKLNKLMSQSFWPPIGFFCHMVSYDSHSFLAGRNPNIVWIEISDCLFERLQRTNLLSRIHPSIHPIHPVQSTQL